MIFIANYEFIIKFSYAGSQKFAALSWNFLWLAVLLYAKYATCATRMRAFCLVHSDLPRFLF